MRSCVNNKKKIMKNKIIEILELGKPQSIIQREGEPITELIHTHILIEELNEQLHIGGTTSRKINVLVTFYGKRQPWQSQRPLYKQIYEVDKLTEINKIFGGEFEDMKILN